jgi:hypothetical protein
MISGVDFDDAEFGFKEEDKTPSKVLISVTLEVAYDRRRMSNILQN